MLGSKSVISVNPDNLATSALDHLEDASLQTKRVAVNPHISMDRIRSGITGIAEKLHNEFLYKTVKNPKATTLLFAVESRQNVLQITWCLVHFNENGKKIIRAKHNQAIRVEWHNIEDPQLAFRVASTSSGESIEADLHAAFKRQSILVSAKPKESNELDADPEVLAADASAAKARQEEEERLLREEQERKKREEEKRNNSVGDFVQPKDYLGLFTNELTVADLQAPISLYDEDEDESLASVSRKDVEMDEEEAKRRGVATYRDQRIGQKLSKIVEIITEHIRPMSRGTYTDLLPWVVMNVEHGFTHAFKAIQEDKGFYVQISPVAAQDVEVWLKSGRIFKLEDLQHFCFLVWFEQSGDKFNFDKITISDQETDAQNSYHLDLVGQEIHSAIIKAFAQHAPAQPAPAQKVSVVSAAQAKAPVVATGSSSMRKPPIVVVSKQEPKKAAESLF